MKYRLGDICSITKRATGIMKAIPGPYTMVVLDKKTKEIWYYEHSLPEGAKAYSKTKPIRIEEFEPIKKWWNNRTENEVAWKVPIQTIIDRNYDLDIKNPNKKVEEIVYDRKAIIEKLEQSFQASMQLLNELKNG